MASDILKTYLVAENRTNIFLPCITVDPLKKVVPGHHYICILCAVGPHTTTIINFPIMPQLDALNKGRIQSLYCSGRTHLKVLRVYFQTTYITQATFHQPSINSLHEVRNFFPVQNRT
jgi:hypothetical protein